MLLHMTAFEQHYFNEGLERLVFAIDEHFGGTTSMRSKPRIHTSSTGIPVFGVVSIGVDHVGRIVVLLLCYSQRRADYLQFGDDALISLTAPVVILNLMVTAESSRLRHSEAYTCCIAFD